MKENTKKYVKLSIILYIVILSVALIGTLAWFVFEKSATISTEEDSKIVAGEYLEICIDDGNDNWVTDIKFDNIVQHPDVSVTPEGKVWYPISLDENEQLFVGEQGKGVYSDVTDVDGYFVKIDLKVRASKGLDVYLHNDSFVRGDMGKTDAKIEDSDKTFSKDAIAGAARVAFLDESGVKLMWIPNEKYNLIVDETGKVTDFVQDGTPENEYKYLKIVDGTVVEGDEYGVWNDDVLSYGDNVLASVDTTAAYANDAKPILSFGEAGEKKITVYIWVEGSDREANTVLSGGELQYNLKLVGVEKKVASSVNISDVSYSGGKLIYTSSGEEVGSEILYSRNSKEWTPYSSGAPLVNGNTVVYVRARETATEMAGDIKEIPIQ